MANVWVTVTGLSSGLLAATFQAGLIAAVKSALGISALDSVRLIGSDLL